METFSSNYKNEFVMDQQKSTVGLSVCQCGWQLSGGGHSYGPKVRDYYVLHYIVKGKGYYRTGDKSFSLKAGQGFLLMPGDTTFYQADMKEPWEYYWVGFVGVESEHLLRLSGLGRDNLIFSYTKDSSLKERISDIYYASKEYAAREIAMVGYLYLLFALLIRQSMLTGIQSKYLEKAIQYIENHYAENITVQEISQYVGVDRSYLYRIFRKTLNVSVKEYIDNLRINRARELLYCSDLSLSEIAVLVGFRDGSHFSNSFKKIFHMSPAAYRKSMLS